MDSERRAYRPALVLGIALAILIGAHISEAQASSARDTSHTCQGFNRRLQISRLSNGEFRMFVSTIDTLAPEGRAGLRSGDEIITINGQPNVLQSGGGLRPKLARGDTNVLVVRRDSIEHTFRYIIGEWQPLPSDSTVVSKDGERVTRVCRAAALRRQDR